MIFYEIILARVTKKGVHKYLLLKIICVIREL